MAEIIHLANDHLVWVKALTDGVTGLPFDDANVVDVTLVDCDGTEVVGATWPIAATAVGDGSGDYYAVLPNELELTVGDEYTAKVVIDDGPGRHAEIELTLVAMKREC